MKTILNHEIIATIYVDHANIFQRQIVKLIKTTFRRHALGTLELELLVKTKWSDILSYEDVYGTETLFVEITKLFNGEVIFKEEHSEAVMITIEKFNTLYLKYKLQLT